MTTIRYTLPHPAPVDLGVYDTKGRRVAMLVHAPESAGHHAVTWSPRGLPSGI